MWCSVPVGCHEFAVQVGCGWGTCFFVSGQKGYVRISSTMFDQLLTRSVNLTYFYRFSGEFSAGWYPSASGNPDGSPDQVGNAATSSDGTKSSSWSQSTRLGTTGNLAIFSTFAASPDKLDVWSLRTSQNTERLGAKFHEIWWFVGHLHCFWSRWIKVHLATCSRSWSLTTPWDEVTSGRVNPASWILFGYAIVREHTLNVELYQGPNDHTKSYLQVFDP